jgi:hypothetical protein
MRRVVVDTSVLAAVTFGEPEGERWAGRLDGCALYGPTLLQYELASVACKKCRQHPEQARQIVRAVALALDTRRGITLMDPNPADELPVAGGIPRSGSGHAGPGARRRRRAVSASRQTTLATCGCLQPLIAGRQNRHAISIHLQRLGEFPDWFPVGSIAGRGSGVNLGRPSASRLSTPALHPGE